MTITIGSPIDLTETRGSMSGRVIPLEERMRAMAPEGSSEMTLDPEEELDPVKIVFNAMFAEFMEKLASGDEEETGNVTLEVNF